MSELCLTVAAHSSVPSGHLDPTGDNSLRAALNKHLPVGQPRYLLRRSADPQAFIQLLGEVDSWTLLRAAATVFFTAYLATLGKHAADATRYGITSLLKRKEAEPLVDFAITLSAEAQKVGKNAVIVIGLSIPDDYDGTSISVRSQNPTDVALAAAAIIAHAEDIWRTMQTEIAASGTPAGPVSVTIQEDGSLLLKWKSGPKFEEREARISVRASLQPQDLT